MDSVKAIIDEVFEYGQGRGKMPGTDELATVIDSLSAPAIRHSL